MRTVTKAVAVAGIAGAVALATSGVASAATGTTITVQAVGTGSKVLKDTAPKGESNPGDKMVFTEKLLQSNKKVGTDRVVQTIQQGNKLLIDGVWTFTTGKQGTLHVHGTLTPGNPNGINLPVVGGTGAFAGKKGTLTVTPGPDGTTEAFHLK